MGNVSIQRLLQSFYSLSLFLYWSSCFMAPSVHATSPSPVLEIDSGEKRLNELGYKQELRREMVIWWSAFVFSTLEYFYGNETYTCFNFMQTLLKTLAITFSSMAVFTGTPLYGQSLLYAGPASMIWGWPVVTFFTWFVGIAMAEICSSFPVCASYPFIQLTTYFFIGF